MVVTKLIAGLCCYAFYQWELYWQEYQAAVTLEERYQATVQTDSWTEQGPRHIPEFCRKCFPKYGVLYSPVKALFLEGCDIDEHAWKFVRDLRFLEFMVVRDCRICVPTGLDFSRLAHLEFLEIENVQLSVSEIRSLTGLARLKGFCVHGTGATNDWATLLTGLSSLEWLWLSGEITDEGVDQIVRLKGLRALGLPKTRISSKACQSIGALPRLEILDLANTPIDDEGIKHLRGLRFLRVLNVRGTAIGDKGVRYLLSLPKLEAVYLDNTRITSASLSTLKNMPSLDPNRVTMEGTGIDEHELTCWRESHRAIRPHNENQQPR